MGKGSISQEETRGTKDTVLSELSDQTGLQHDDTQALESSKPLLSPDEIETLLNTLSQGKIEDKKHSIINASEIPDGVHILTKRKSNRKDINVKEHDLTESSHLSKDCIKDLRTLHNSYAERLSSNFSETLAANVNVECIYIEQLTYGEYLASLMDPSCIGIFSMKPLDNIGAIEMSSTCVFSIIDKILGGSGLSKPYNRPLTSIEETIIIRIIEKALRILRELWNQNTNVDIKLERLEKDPNLTRIAAPESSMVLVLFRIKLNDVCGMMSLCFPYAFVKRTFENVKERKFSGLINRKNVKSYENEIQGHILNMRVNVSARYESGSVTLGEFMELQKGDIIKLKKADKDRVVILIEGERKFFGKPGVVNGQRAVQICESEVNNGKV